MDTLQQIAKLVTGYELVEFNTRDVRKYKEYYITKQSEDNSLDKTKTYVAPYIPDKNTIQAIYDKGVEIENSITGVFRKDNAIFHVCVGYYLDHGECVKIPSWVAILYDFSSIDKKIVYFDK